MCEQKTKRYVCSRCSNLIFLGPSIITECDRCEPDLCSRCPFLSADSPLPFTGKPDVAPGSAHDVEDCTKSHQSKKVPYEYVGSPALAKTRKMYLVGGVDPNQKERDDRLNRELDYWLTKELELMNMRDPSGGYVQEIEDEPKEESKDEPKDELKDELKNELKDELKNELKDDLKDELKNELKDEPKTDSKTECRCICKCKGMFKKKSKDEFKVSKMESKEE
ncbi:hypothetical protein FPSE5266_03939 [Fusarium pseudograminearum]|nr:hypothetical protein FPSE5266_03939 [Fusarium pseudograminearum]